MDKKKENGIKKCLIVIVILILLCNSINQFIKNDALEQVILDKQYKINQQKQVLLYNSNELSKKELQIEELISIGYLEYEVTTYQIDNFLFNIGLNKNEYILDKYDCVDYSNQMINDLREAGYYSCSTYLLLDNEIAHNLIAVMTVDGILYIEPQENNYYLNLVPGDYYWNEEIIYIKSCFGSFF